MELVWSPKVNDLPGEYRVGYYKSTAKANDVFEDVNGTRCATTGAYRVHNSKHGYWFVAQQQLTSHNGEPPRPEHRRQRHLPRQGHQRNRQLPVADVRLQRGRSTPGQRMTSALVSPRIHVNDDVKKNAQLANARVVV